jgi:hypothetical protein
MLWIAYAAYITLWYLLIPYGERSGETLQQAKFELGYSAGQNYLIDRGISTFQ